MGICPECGHTPWPGAHACDRCGAPIGGGAAAAELAIASPAATTEPGDDAADPSPYALTARLESRFNVDRRAESLAAVPAAPPERRPDVVEGPADLPPDAPLARAGRAVPRPLERFDTPVPEVAPFLPEAPDAPMPDLDVKRPVSRPVATAPPPPGGPQFLGSSVPRGLHGAPPGLGAPNAVGASPAGASASRARSGRRVRSALWLACAVGAAIALAAVALVLR